MIDRLKVFQTELKEIQTENIRKYAELAIQNVLPEYFFYVPASSTGKYHPEYAIGTGGLVRHTKAMAKIAIDVLGLEYLQYTQAEKDLSMEGKEERHEVYQPVERLHGSKHDEPFERQ